MSGDRTLAVNRKARRDYEILETYEAGLVLTGTEIKSARAGRANLGDAYAASEGGEMWLYNMHISPYEHGNRYNPDPKRSRKLLMHRWEINRLIGKTQERGLTLVPLRLYLHNGYAKVQLGLARGRKAHDKRRAMAERDAEMERRRHLGPRGRLALDSE